MVAMCLLIYLMVYTSRKLEELYGQLERQLYVVKVPTWSGTRVSHLSHFETYGLYWGNGRNLLTADARENSESGFSIDRAALKAVKSHAQLRGINEARHSE
jgi:hypothetical protein